LRIALLIAGLAFAQFILYGPSLAGRKILLPLDLLGRAGWYLPPPSEIARPQTADPTVSDLILQFEPARRFAASELHAGRLPMWAPYQYAGAPFIWP
jgi:hypothetical protein